jgi:mRNA-degrading endonuclease RelE of RelBE toxin-antitoxin system
VIRRAAARRFPYRIVYTLEETSIEVLAFAHGKRNPGY